MSEGFLALNSAHSSAVEALALFAERFGPRAQLRECIASVLRCSSHRDHAGSVEFLVWRAGGVRLGGGRRLSPAEPIPSFCNLLRQGSVCISCQSPSLCQANFRNCA